MFMAVIMRVPMLMFMCVSMGMVVSVHVDQAGQIGLRTESPQRHQHHIAADPVCTVNIDPAHLFSLFINSLHPTGSIRLFAPAAGL
jgi:hypothetical protein